MEYAERCDWEDGIHQDDPTILETLSEIAINDDPDDEDLDAIELDDDEYFDLEADVHDDFDPYELEDRLMDEHGVTAEGFAYTSDAINELVVEEEGIQSTINQIFDEMLTSEDVPLELIKKYAMQIHGFTAKLRLVGADQDMLTDDEQDWMRVVSETHQEFIKALMPGENHAE